MILFTSHAHRESGRSHPVQNNNTREGSSGLANLELSAYLIDSQTLRSTNAKGMLALQRSIGNRALQRKVMANAVIEDNYQGQGSGNHLQNPIQCAVFKTDASTALVASIKDPYHNLLFVEGKSEVDVIQEQTGNLGELWCEVKIRSGAAKGKQGWIRKSALTKYVESSTEMESIFQSMQQASFVNTRGENASLPYHYPPDGCYARAHFLSDLLTSMGYKNDKVFLISAVQGLKAQTAYGEDLADYGEKPAVSWWYHVAPIVYAHDGSDTPYVLDPSLADAPLTIPEWNAKMGVGQVREMNYTDLVNELDAQKKYPSDPIEVKTQKGIYTPPSATDPYNTNWASVDYAQSGKATLTKYSDKAKAHEITAQISRLAEQFSISFETHRDSYPPFLAYPNDYGALVSTVQSTTKEIREYVNTKFPKLLDDLFYTTLGSAVEQDIRSFLSELRK